MVGRRRRGRQSVRGPAPKKAKVEKVPELKNDEQEPGVAEEHNEDAKVELEEEKLKENLEQEETGEVEKVDEEVNKDDKEQEVEQKVEQEVKKHEEDVEKGEDQLEKEEIPAKDGSEEETERAKKDDVVANVESVENIETTPIAEGTEELKSTEQKIDDSSEKPKDEREESNKEDVEKTDESTDKVGEVKESDETKITETENNGDVQVIDTQKNEAEKDADGQVIETLPTVEISNEKEEGVTKFLFDGVEYKFKERASVLEEKDGKIEFRVVNCDNSKESMMILTGLKNIFQKQLPKMPKEYIARLVYDRSHVSMAVVRKPLTVVGGITFRPFNNREFAEIVFCAISSTEQVRGYGAHLMNHLKDYVRHSSPIKYFLTYADNYAIGYFKKQGFTKEITLDKKMWMGYIKDYEGGTLMQCSMLPRIRYLDAPKILLLQEAALMRKIRTISQSHIIRAGLDQFKDLNNIKPIDPMTIPGLKEAGWTSEMDELAQRPKRGPHYAAMQNILTELQNHAAAWPFLQPVNREEVPDYYEFIKEPMDLSTMEIKLENNRYEKMENYVHDARLIFDNCRKYNGDNTSYFKYANRLEKFFNSKVKEYPEYSQLVEN